MKKDQHKITKTMRTKLQVKFDYASDLMKRGDVAGAREIVQDEWILMLPLFDPKAVIQMVHPVTLLNYFDVLCERERYIRATQSFLKQVLSDPMTSEFKVILQLYPDELRSFGIDPDVYSDTFAKYYAKDFIGDIDCLPEVLSADKLISNVNMSDILEDVSYWKFDDFLKKFIEADGDTDLLANKFIQEIGYTSVYDEFSALFDLLEVGCDIDIEYFADCVDVEILNSEEKDRYYQVLKERGADRTILDRFAA